MSSGKFASVTASLLARKGEGQPWMQASAQESVRQPLAWRSDMPTASVAAPPPEAWGARPAVAAPPPPPRVEIRTAPPAMAAPPPPPPVKGKSCSLRMSLHDFERLGILAVKAGVPRQVLLKDALAQLLNTKARDYGCACLGECERNCGQPD